MRAKHHNTTQSRPTLTGPGSPSPVFSIVPLLTIFLLALRTGALGADTAVTVLFLGDSLTAGYGLDPDLAYPALVQEKIDRAKLPFRTVNAGLSGETSAGGLRRLNWLLRRKFDVLVLALGANDGLRGLDLDATRANLQGIIDRVRKEYSSVVVVIAGMRVPPNMGPDYASQFDRLFPELAEENNAVLIPFLLEGVAARPELNLADGIHPNSAGHKIIAENVWTFLQPILVQLAARTP